MGFVGSRGRLRSTLARGKGRNLSEGAGADVNNAAAGSGFGGGLGAGAGFGAGFASTRVVANFGARAMLFGGGFFTEGFATTGSTASGPSRGGCDASKSFRGVWPNSSIWSAKAARRR